VLKENPLSTKNSEWLTPAECAKRTGLTVRALRVYERYALVTGERTAAGWRRYGPDDLARLNTIAVLKSLGMTLAQIRDLMQRKPPSLQDVLHAQIESCKQKRAAAELGQAIAEYALRQLQMDQQLSLDELCQSVRSMQPSDPERLIQNLVVERVTAQEQQAWRRWWREHPAEKANLVLFVEKQSLIFRKLDRHLKAGLDPSGVQVQEVVQRRFHLIRDHRVLESLLDQLEWNPEITRKMYRMEEALMQRVREGKMPQNQPLVAPSAELWKFYLNAVERLPWWSSLTEILEHVSGLAQARGSPSVDTSWPAERLRQLFRENALGNPGSWARFYSIPHHPDYGLDMWAAPIHTAAWAFIAKSDWLSRA
jgi:DNA-binding transcriptional MerR regulator